MRRDFTKVAGNVEPVYDEAYELWLRPGTDDIAIAKGMRTHVPMPISKGDYILELGGNIGAFGKWALAQGAGIVWAYEADADNFSMYMRNRRPNAAVWNRAVVNRAVDTVQLYTTTKKGKGRHSLVPHKTYTPQWVSAIHINTVFHEMAAAHMSPDKLKVDIEGAEFEVFGVRPDINGNLPILLPPTLRGIAIEYHVGPNGALRPADTLRYTREVHKLLLAQGFKPVRPPNFDKKGWGSTQSYYEREV